MSVEIALKSDAGTFHYTAAKDGKIRFTHNALDDGLALLPSQVLVILNRGGPAVFYPRDRTEEEKDVSALQSLAAAGYGPTA
jgi:hypothetical protein